MIGEEIRGQKNLPNSLVTTAQANTDPRFHSFPAFVGRCLTSFCFYLRHVVYSKTKS